MSKLTNFARQHPRLTAFLILLIITPLAAYAAWSRYYDSRDGTQTIPNIVNNNNNNVGLTTSQPNIITSDGNLTFRLSQGKPSADSFEILPPSAGTPLSANQIQTLLARLPNLDTNPNDQTDFRIPEAPLPPPQPGLTIPQPFPLRPTLDRQPTVTDGPLEILRFSPQGEIPLAPFLSVTFNQPMVPLSTLDQLTAADVPVQLTPNLPGVWRWLGTQTLTFEFDEQSGVRFPMATDFTATIPAGTTSANGDALAQTVTWQFATPAPKLTTYFPTSVQPTDPILFAAFDQQIDPQAVLNNTTLTADGRDVDITLLSATDLDDDSPIHTYIKNSRDGYWLIFRPTTQLPTSANIVTTFAPGTPSAEGPRTTTQPQTFSFSTYSPLEVTDHSCGWYNDDDCPPFTPLFIQFNNPLDRDTFTADQITIEPALPGATVQMYGSRIEIHGPTRGRTTYFVTLSADLQDSFGQTLGNTEELRFRIGSAPSALSGPNEPLVTLDPSAPNPSLPIYTINYDRLDVEIYRVSPSDWPDFLHYRDNYYSNNSATPPGERISDETINIDSEADALTELPIDLSQAFADSNHIVLVVQPPALLDSQRRRNPVVQLWVQKTNIGLDAFNDNDKLIAWATNLQDGTPLTNLSLNLYPNGQTVTTDNQGLATFDLNAGRGGMLIATQGNDTTILPASTYHWEPNNWQSRPQNDALRWYVFDDRQMYRPGEDVHIKGWVRLIDNNTSYDIQSPPTGMTAIQYQIYDPQWNEMTSGQVDINSFGGFDFNFTIPENSNLGYAYINFSPVGVLNNIGWREHEHGFQIQEFRRPEFSVSARVESAGPHFIGTPATVAVEASYFAGGALPNADVSWQVCATPGTYSPPNWPDFTFGTWTPWWFNYGYDSGGRYYEDDIVYYEEGYGDQNNPCQNFSGTTDPLGADYLQIDFDDLTKPQPFNINATATVMDTNRQAWSASTSLLVHPADYYIGLRSERAFVRQGEPMDIAAIVTNIDGQPVAGRPITILAERREWQYTANGWEEVTIATQDCTTTSATEPILCTFTTDDGGTYQITATTTDNNGNQHQSQMTRWVPGGQQQPQRQITQEAVTLIPDKEQYAPGDTAEILVQSPFGPASGLLTVSRGPILYTERFDVGPDGHILRVPINAEHIPNLYVKVDLSGQATRTDDQGNLLPDAPSRPAFATAQLNLDISTDQRTLDVQVAPAQARLEPGASTAVDLLITDHNGAPVSNAEIALVVVDEAVLALTNYQMTDPVSFFYNYRGSDISSIYGRSSILLSNPETLNTELKSTLQTSNDDAVEESMAYAADGAAEMDTAMPTSIAGEAARQVEGEPVDPNTPIRVRTNFDPLAIFAPTVTTGADGRARVNVDLPDNLTRYRIMAVAVANQNQFGTGESNLTARLPLMVRPSAPRFLNFGDQFQLPILLQNQTDADLLVDVVVRASTVSLVDGLDDGTVAGQQILVPANDRVELRFPATTLSAGTARFQIAATSGNYADAATIDLPVYTPATTEAFATYGVVDNGAIAQPIDRPTNVFSQFGGLEIQTSSTALQALTDAVLYLYEYPYRSSSHSASRLLAIAGLRDVLSAFEADGLPDPDTLTTFVQGDIEYLEGLQNFDGGWPSWRRGDESIPYYSIHVAHALYEAQAKGFTLNDNVTQQTLRYLANIENHYPSWYSENTRRALSAYAVHVRHLYGDSDTAKAARLYDELSLDDHSLETLAWLWPIFSASNDTERTDAIGLHFNNRAVETANAANFTTSYGDDAYLMLHSDRRTDGLILDSLITVQPDSDLIPKVVNGLLANRVRGRWGNTQENAFILLAMDNYFNTFEAQTPDFVARIWLGDTYAAQHTYEGRTTERHETIIPMNFLTAGPASQDIIIDKAGDGRLYYRLGLRYAPSDLNLDPLDMGFTVQRRYEAVDNPDDVYQDEDGRWHIRAGARVRVQLDMVTSNRRYHVALVDPLPAGLEIINPSLAVSGDVPANPSRSDNYGWWWWGTWYQHQNMRDERAEAFTTLLWDGTYSYSYVTRATTPGTFIVPPAKAEEMYSPEIFGRTSTDIVIVE
ncbi:MAG TPA: alpha-2-macroglobulin family protein [Anaerolineae bacterium]|nr:alpha-2-macroglobulin family protein [Anaerolineae bacterium]